MELTIKEIAKKYGLEYHIVYLGLSEAGLTHCGKNRRYNEMGAVAAVSHYLISRIDRHKAKIYGYLEMMEQINACLKKEGQKQG